MATLAEMVPASHVALISPDDDNDLAFVTRAISFAAPGTLRVMTMRDIVP